MHPWLKGVDAAPPPGPGAPVYCYTLDMSIDAAPMKLYGLAWLDADGWRWHTSPWGGILPGWPAGERVTMELVQWTV